MRRRTSITFPLNTLDVVSWLVRVAFSTPSRALHVTELVSMQAG